MLNDLAEAMKALDGKKNVEEICAVGLQFGHNILLLLDLQAFVTF